MSTFTLVSVISAQQQAGSKFGIIASLQNGKDGKPAWIVSGVNSTSPNSMLHSISYF
ncbi:MAG: hypothetical protein WCF23_13955 [Candidatus Nitrosopolaris sp.]